MMYAKRKTAAVVLACGLMLLALPANVSCGGGSHTLEFVEERKATCTEAGISGHWRCKDCGRLFSDETASEEITGIEIGPLGHIYGEGVLRGATCTEPGLYSRACLRCGEAEETTISPTGHIFGSYLVTRAATCFSEGTEARICAICGEKEERTIPPTGRHSWTRSNRCTVCGIQAYPTEGLQYASVVEKGELLGYIVYGRTVVEENVVIPYYYREAPVIGIGEEAFYGSASLKELVLYAEVREIGNRAFGGCTELRSVSLPEGLVTIGEDAFRDCGSLTELNFPDSLRTVGREAFYGCSSITRLHVGKELAEIGRSAFYNCCGLNEITASADNAVYLGEGNCLVERESGTLVLGSNRANVPSVVREIADYAFLGCAGLTSVSLPAGLTRIGDFAFRDCVSLKEIVFGGSRTQWKAVEKGTQWARYTSENLVIRCTDGYGEVE